MTFWEGFYLVLSLIAFGGFAGTLAWESHKDSKRAAKN